MRTVQSYIEEVPVWANGNRLPGPPLSTMQWLVWSLATAGKFFEGLIVFMGGIALPLLSRQFAIGPTTMGLVTAAPLFGILIGALLLGGLADRFGRKFVFVGEMLLLLLALLSAALSSHVDALVASLFVVGVALGADYPTAHLVITESIPSAIRGRLVLGAFSFQALGAVVGTAIAAVLLGIRPDLDTWRIFYLIPVVPIAFVAWGRLLLPESSHWLMSRGHQARAEQELARLLNRDDVSLIAPTHHHGFASQGSPWSRLFRGKYQRATILASVPWFLQDLSTYGIGIFTPLIVASAFGMASQENDLAAVIRNDLLGARGTALIDLGFLIGIGVAIALADRIGRIPLQIVGFMGCAAGLLIAGVGGDGQGPQLAWVVGGFVIFQFMTNLGPNSQTYLIAGEVFPTPLRGLGSGLAAATGKVGAVLTAFWFPQLLESIGKSNLLVVLAITSVVGAVVTWCYRIETKGLDVEHL